MIIRKLGMNGGWGFLPGSMLTDLGVCLCVYVCECVRTPGCEVTRFRELIDDLLEELVTSHSKTGKTE